MNTCKSLSFFYSLTANNRTPLQNKTSQENRENPERSTGCSANHCLLQATTLTIIK